MAKNSVWYSVWKWYLGKSLEMFFHRLESSGLENIPKGKPVIFASNHTNALIDPLVINYFSGTQDYFMTRGDVFKMKPIGALFRSWRMLPIFRMKDGIDTLAQNNPIMEFVINQLKDGYTIIIFPEGSHYWIRNVQPLRKGLVRMAFDVVEGKPDSELVVVPVGLHYDDMININRDVLVSFGPGISVADFPKEENMQKTYLAFNKELRQRMKKLVICIAQTDLYQKKEHLRIQLDKHLKHLPLKQGFDIQQEFINDVEMLEEQNALKLEAVSNLDELLAMNEFERWRIKLAEFKKTAPGDSRLVYALKMPLYLISAIHFIPVMFIARKILSKAKDRTFHNSIKFGLGLLLQGIISLIVAIIIGVVLQNAWYGILYLALMPVWVNFFVELQGRRNHVFNSRG